MGQKIQFDENMILVAIHYVLKPRSDYTPCFLLIKQLQNFHQHQMTYNRNGIYYERTKMEATRYQEQKAQLYDVFRQKGFGSWKERENKDNFSL